MQFVRGLSNLQAYRQRPRVLTIGNFDGVHSGHQMILRQVVEKAEELDLMSSVMFFEPQPKELFRKHNQPPRLTPLGEKTRQIFANGIESIICLRFNEALFSRQPMDFVKDILVDGLNVQHLIIGDDFRFGRNQGGNYELLQEAGEKFGFGIEQAQTYLVDGARVSSTRVRYALQENNLALAEKLLGRPYSMFGRVIPGQALARQLGVPTANMSLKGKLPPVTGVFAVTVTGLEDLTDGKPLQGVANVGTRPTVNGVMPLLETHLFDFNHDIYGRRMRVTFLQKMREEVRFESVDALKDQIYKDIDQARAYFDQNG